MDFYLFQQINQLAGRWPWLDALAVFFARESGYLLIIFLFIFLLCRRNKKYRIMIGEAILAAFLARFGIVSLIRLIFFRPRPFVNHQVNLLLAHQPDASFPSGHAAFFFALSLVVYIFNKKAGFLFLAVSSLMGFARVLGGIHYPSDIFGGILVGLFSAWFVTQYLRNYVCRISDRISKKISNDD